MMSHINSYKRKKLNNRSPYDAFSFYYREDPDFLLNALYHVKEQMKIREIRLQNGIFVCKAGLSPHYSPKPILQKSDCPHYLSNINKNILTFDLPGAILTVQNGK